MVDITAPSMPPARLQLPLHGVPAAVLATRSKGGGPC